jgi:tRNA(Arg) A34 adenosine deaminase TadA
MICGVGRFIFSKLATKSPPLIGSTPNRPYLLIARINTDFMHHRFLILTAFILLAARSIAVASPADSLENTSPADRASLLRQLMALPCGIEAADAKPVILKKIDRWLKAYRPDPAFAEDRFAKAAVAQALAGTLAGGYGIGAVLVDGNGKILHGACNAQLQTGRSDLHAEMNLLTEFETLPQFRKYRSKGNFTGGGNTIYSEQLRLYTSAEPCPMCFIRVAIAGVDTRYVTTGPDDGMNRRAACLPPFWYQLSQKHRVEQAQTAPVLRQLAHCLFYSFLL